MKNGLEVEINRYSIFKKGFTLIKVKRNLRGKKLQKTKMDGSKHKGVQRKQGAVPMRYI